MENGDKKSRRRLIWTWIVWIAIMVIAILAIVFFILPEFFALP